MHVQVAYDYAPTDRRARSDDPYRIAHTPLWRRRSTSRLSNPTRDEDGNKPRCYVAARSVPEDRLCTRNLIRPGSNSGRKPGSELPKPSQELCHSMSTDRDHATDFSRTLHKLRYTGSVHIG